jgi:hypothetical protein
MKLRNVNILLLSLLQIPKRKIKPVNIYRFFINYKVPFYVVNEQKAEGDLSGDLTKLKDIMDSDLFYMYKYKTAYCP